MSFAILTALIVKQFTLLKEALIDGDNKVFFKQFLNGFLVVSTSLFIFLIYLPLILQLALILVVILVIVATISAVMGPYAYETADSSGNSSSSYSGTTYTTVQGEWLAFTEEELAAYGSALSGYEKNMYRLGVASKFTADNYQGKSSMKELDKYLTSLFILGIASTETGMKFWDKPLQHKDKEGNILTEATNKAINSSGFGTLGLCGKVGGCGKHSIEYKLGALDEGTRSALVNKWGNPPRDRDINFYPYGTAFTYKHLTFKTGPVDRFIDKAMEVIQNQWGIKSNLDEHRAIIYHFMLQAAYHGVEFKPEIEHYANFWGALLHSTSDVEEERSFYKWTISDKSVGDYTESSMRKTMYGTTSCGNRPVNTNVSSWKRSGTVVELNGQEITQTVWGYLLAKYPDHKGLQAALEKTVSMGKGCGTGYSDRSLNFHYGFNSFIQANTIVKVLATKMGIPKPEARTIANGSDTPAGQIISGSTTGGLPAKVNGPLTLGMKLRPQMLGVTAIGKAQSYIYGSNGKKQSMHSFLEDYYSRNHTKTYRTKYKNTIGSSEHLQGKLTFTPQQLKEYDKYNFYNVPFSRQLHWGGKTAETYALLPLSLGGSRYTIGSHGCMVFATAYIASAISGHYITPPEMFLYMQAKGYMLGAASKDQMHGVIFKQLGGPTIKTQHIQNGSHKTTMTKVTESLKKGNGLAVIRLGPPYASGSNHYVALTGAVKAPDGTIQYSMYSSSSIKDSIRLHTLSDLQRHPGDRNSATIVHY